MTDQEPPSRDFVRGPDYVERYANNIRFEASAWDLRVLFGLLDQSESPLMIHQHTAMNISWQHAKVAAYFLMVNIAIQEARNGNIEIPASVMPDPLDSYFEDLKEDDKAKAMLERVRRIRSELFQEQ